MLFTPHKIYFKFILLLFFFCLLHVELISQVTANFTANKTSGCRPLTGVQFSDLSSGNITYREWHLGTGLPIIGNDSIVNNVYVNPGCYDIQLIVSDGVFFDTLLLTDYICVYDLPQPAFTFSDTGGCAPFTTTFYDQSTAPGVGILELEWIFGDGTDSIQFDSVAHTYISGGTQTVCLIVTDSNNCVNTLCDTVYVFSPPVINFSVAGTSSSCDPPLDVNFINQTTGAGLGTYFWDFGDGNTSVLTSPSHTYTSIGSYDVTLIAENSFGCRDTLVKNNFVQVATILAQIFFSRDSLCNGETLNYAVVSTGASTAEWNWPCCGVSDIGYSGDIIFPPATSGFQIVELVLTGFGGCTDTIYDSVFVEIPVADFFLNSTYFCESPTNISFTDNSTSTSGISSWSWQFSTGLNSAVQNPIINLDTTGYISANLQIISNIGCTDSIHKDSVAFIFEVQPTILASPRRGCFPLTVQFTGGEAFGNIDSIQQWKWYFDDPISGSNDSSDIQNPSHIFNQTGIYFVTLTVTDSSGCTHSRVQRITVGESVLADFSNPDTVCAKDPVVFTDLSTNPALVNEWFWDFGDGVTDTAQNPSHLYSDTGYFTVTLIASNFGCSDTLELDSAVYVLAPIIELTATVDCSNPYEISYQIINKGADKWYLNFGDGSPIDSINLSGTHTYSSKGDYTITVNGYNNATGCDYEATAVVYIRVIQADFIPVTPVTCNNNAIALDGSVSTDAVTWEWTVQNDLTLYGGNPFTYTFLLPDTYLVKLVAYDVNGCKDSIEKPVFVKYINAFFSFDTTNGCAPLSVNFSDSSYSDNGIISWSWNFGDGFTDTVANPTHVFNTAGNFFPTLTITDSIGCSISYTSSVAVAAFGPVISISLLDSLICEGDTAVFINNTYDPFLGAGITYEWHFGDGNTSTLQNPTNIYSDTGFFDIMLIATELTYGCKDTMTFPNILQVQGIPIANFYADPPFAGCFPGFIQFLDSSQSNYINYWQWSFGNGATSCCNISNPGYVYPVLGFYDITLIVGTTAGCRDTITKNDYISIFGPYASIQIVPDSVCKGEDVLLIIDSLYNVTQVDWYYGDGKLTTNVTQDTTIYQYNQTGTFLVSLVYQSDSLCKFVIQDSVFVHTVSADFSVSDSVTCIEQSNIEFINISQNASSWTWYFGDGNSQIGLDTITHQYQDTGKYLAQLIIQDISSGCIDTAEKIVDIVSVIGVEFPNDTLLCFGDTILLQTLTDTSNIVLWDANNMYISDTIGISIEASTSTSNYVFIQIIDEKGCLANDSVYIHVIYPFQSTLVTPATGDTTIIIGESVPIEIFTNPSNGLMYTWIPEDALSCVDCISPISTPSENINYTLIISDSNSCFMDTINVSIEVIKKYTVSVPTAFSPNGDGNNDIIYVRGWGIKELNEYRIYNRWGELVYENPGDIKQGWDGKYKGQIQPIETYAVTVVATAINNETLTYKGFINILK